MLNFNRWKYIIDTKNNTGRKRICKNTTKSFPSNSTRLCDTRNGHFIISKRLHLEIIMEYVCRFFFKDTGHQLRPNWVSAIMDGATLKWKSATNEPHRRRALDALPERPASTEWYRRVRILPPECHIRQFAILLTSRHRSIDSMHANEVHLHQSGKTWNEIRFDSNVFICQFFGQELFRSDEQ